MRIGDAKSMATLGFLTVIEHPQYGLFGGYLVLNMAGRPLEFHCTTPIKPNRAQEILYGPTLDAFLYGEQIGQTLLSQAKTEPLVLCTDRAPVLAAREFVATPMVLVLSAECDVAPEPQLECVPQPVVRPAADATGNVAADPTAKAIAPQGKFLRLDSAHKHGPRLVIFQLGRNRLALPERADDDRRQIADRLADVAGTFDLAEPFQRIRAAIEEAQQALR
jgi:hypothetical protein